MFSFEKKLTKKQKKFRLLSIAVQALVPLFILNLLIRAPFISAQDEAIAVLVQKIGSFFPKIEGYIIEIKDDKAYLDLGLKSGVGLDMELFCFREGEEFSHPVTGEILGRFQNNIGVLKIVEVNEKYSIGEIIDSIQKNPIKRGDRAGVPLKRLPLALLTKHPESPQIAYLRTLMEQTPRFTIIPQNEINHALDALGIPDEAEGLSSSQFKALGTKIGASYIIIPSIQKITKRRFLDAKIISAYTGLQLTRFKQEMGEDIRMAGGESSSKDPNVSNTVGGKFTGFPAGTLLSAAKLSNELPFAFEFLSAGDVTGDGNREICASDGRNILLFSWNGKELKELFRLKGKPSDNHISLDIADINDNGRSEVFINNMYHGFLSSFVLEWEGRGLKRIWDSDALFLRIMQIYPKEDILLGQIRGVTEPFDREADEYAWDKGTYAPVRKIRLPQKEDIFDIGMADFDADGKEEVVCLDSALTLYRNGKRIWKSDIAYGGKESFFEHEIKGPISIEEEKRRVYLKSHMLIGDVNKNGKPDIMVIKNTSSAGKIFPRSPVYRKGEVCLIEWDGIAFSETWHSGKIEAYLADIALTDIDHDGIDDLLLSMIIKKGIGTFWKENYSKMLFY